MINHVRDMMAWWVIALPLALVGLPVLLWLFVHGVLALTWVLDAIQDAVLG